MADRPPTGEESAEPITFRGVTKRYGDVTALDAVDLEIRPDEIHCLVGPNGSGKTTLFDLLLGLTRPTAGRVERSGATLGCSFQTPTFYPDLTVRENLTVFARLTHAPDDGWRETVTEEFRLDRVAGRLAGTLSGGWQKKLDLALAFLERPAYAVLDEPLDDLDDISKRRLRAFLDDYRDVGGVLVATHHVGAFEPILDRLTVIDDGTILYDGPVEEGTAHERYLDLVE
ncbi:MAG: ATP-binding cassette domain-containing protein [Haloarculaceae archaeon]